MRVARDIALPESLEHVRQKRRRDADPGIRDDELDARFGDVERDAHRSALGREPDGVGHQISDDLLQPHGVADDDGRIVAQLDRHRDRFRRRKRLRRCNHRLDDRPERHRFGVEPELPGDDARHVEDVADDLLLHPRVPLDSLERLRAAGLVHLRAAQQSRPSEHRVQRRAQLVRYGRQKFVLQLVRDLRCLARFLHRVEQPRVVDGDRGLRREPCDDALSSVGEHVWLGVAEKQPAEHLAGPADHRDREITAHRQVPAWNAVMRLVLAVA